MFDKEKLKQKIKTVLSLDSTPSHIAAGFAVGVFISFTPFFGVHTFLAIALAFILRVNKVACLTGAWLNTPLTVVPMLVASYNLGRFLRGKPAKELTFKTLDWHSMQPYAKSLLLGSSIIGFVTALLSYAVCYWLIVTFRRKDAAIAELTRESEEVGEELE